MPEFVARIGWPDGGVAEESIISPDRSAARLEFERRGAHVFDIRERAAAFGFGFRRGRRRRVKMAHFLVFNQELVALLKAGLPILRSIELLLERQQNPVWKEVLTDVRDRITSGASLSEAFAAQGDIFPRLYATSLKAGEKAGEIEPVLRRYLKYQKTIVALQRKVVSTLIYPAILIAVSVGLISILMTFVIPRFTEFFSEFGSDLPLLTRLVVGTATTIRANIVWIAAGLAIVVFGLTRYGRSERGREFFHAQLLKIWFVGGIFRRFSISQFTRSLATLLSGGTPLVPSLETASEAIGNRYVSKKIAQTVPRVREGGELWHALEDTGMMTNLTIEMVKVGESSGALEEMLNSASEFYDEEIDALLARVISFVEPAVLVFMGIVIATILMAVYLPLFTILSNMKG
ncbi:MAG TPA: type II secretion system F family protein [Thermoanaerobaculia bacterium]|nr:type II secretion system F family protein [Thermoanaerobaculia bacterium]